jgi:hypothetical protein
MKLLLFTVCEKVIINQRLNSVSLMELLQDLAVALPAGNVPVGAAVPMRWESFALWLREEGDQGRRYTQHVELHSPDRKPLLASDLSFTVDKAVQRNINTFQVFPLVGPGTYTVVLSVRQEDEDAYREVASYPLTVTYNPD